MRRKNEQDTNGNGTGRIKFRVIEIEVDGANETLAEGIKALTLALSKGSTPTAARALPAPKHAAAAVVTDTASVEEQEIEEEAAVEEQEGSTAAPARPKRTAATPTTPDVLSDIDLNSGKISLKDYVAQKAPSGPQEMYATIAVWYKENHNLDEVNDDRIYTAYRFLNEVPPNNVAQVLRQLKFNKWFDKGTTKGGYKINIVGLNKVHAKFK